MILWLYIGRKNNGTGIMKWLTTLRGIERIIKILLPDSFFCLSWFVFVFTLKFLPWVFTVKQMINAIMPGPHTLHQHEAFLNLQLLPQDETREDTIFWKWGKIRGVFGLNQHTGSSSKQAWWFPLFTNFGRQKYLPQSHTENSLLSVVN